MDTLDNYRMPHESEIEWGLRRKFLEAHREKFDNINRWLCMASCFINVELYGCRYPNKVMIELKGLIEEIIDDVQEFRQGVRERTGMKFVKESGDTANSGGKPTSCTSFIKSEVTSTDIRVATAQGSTTAAYSIPNERSNKYANFVKSSNLETKADSSQDKGSVYCSSISGTTNTEPKTVCTWQQEKVRKTKDGRVQTLSKTVISNVHGKRVPQTATAPSVVCSPEVSEVVEKSTLDQIRTSVDAIYQFHSRPSYNLSTENGVITLSGIFHRKKVAHDLSYDQITKDGRFVCHLKICGVSVASSNPAPSKKTAKRDAYEKALCLLRKPNICLDVGASGNLMLLGSDIPFSLGRSQPFHKSVQRRKRTAAHFETGDFFILQHLSAAHQSQNAVGIVTQSAAFSKKHITWDFRQEGCETACLVNIDGQAFAEEYAESKQAAKKAAAESVLAHLRTVCWTIIMKQAADSDDHEGIARSGLIGEPDKLDQPLADTNVGSKMLRLMGWSGGGIGKNEQGIAEPIQVTSVVRRKGFGAEGDSGRSIIRHIRGFLNDYLCSDREDDLVFSSEFSKEERACIHTACNNLNLRSQSRGKGQDRYLIVSRKRSPTQLFEFLQRAGGETAKYKLLAPGEGLPGTAEAGTIS